MIMNINISEIVKLGKSYLDGLEIENSKHESRLILSKEIKKSESEIRKEREKRRRNEAIMMTINIPYHPSINLVGPAYLRFLARAYPSRHPVVH